MLKLVTGALSPPVDINEVKDQIRGLDRSTSEDPHIDLLVSAVTNMVETYTGRALMPQTWDWFMDDTPLEISIEIPRPPLQAITSIKTVDQSDVSTTFAASNYFVDIDSEPGRVALKTSVSWPTGLLWPTTTLKTVNGFVIRFIAGYADADAIPSDIKMAIIRAVDALYSTRKAKKTSSGETMVKLALPKEVEMILTPYKIFKVGF